jgi:EmrB/QacA subfamily drug resistance transporter
MNNQPGNTSASGLSTSTKAIVLTTFSIATFLPSFMAQGLNIALPIIGREFGADAITLNWMVLAFVLANAALSLPIGRISDVIGIRKVFLYGMIFYTLSSFAMMFFNSPLMIIICRAAQGVSGSMILVNIMALITAIFPAKERGLAFGINVASVYVGASIGPFLGGLLTQFFGWKSIFLVNVFIGIIVVMLTLWKVKGGWIENQRQRIDYLGAIVYTSSLVILVYGFSLLPEITGVILILIGLLGLTLFFLWENKAASPLFDVKVFRYNRLFIFSNLVAIINYIAVFAVAFLLSLYLQYIKGLTPVLAGFIMIANPVVQAVLSPIAGRLSDKMEPRVVASIGMGLTTLSLLSFVFLSSDTPLIIVIIALIMLGTGFALFLSPNSNAIMSSVTPKYYGIASATMSTMISGGQTLSMGITMVVMTIIIGRVAITPEYYPAFLTSAKIAFGIFAFLCFCGVIISLARGRMR